MTGVPQLPQKRGDTHGVIVARDGTPLYYETWGSGPVLVLNGALLWDPEAWRAFIAQFSRRYRVVRWDYRGHGRSGDPQNALRPFELDLFIRDLEAVLNHLRVDHGTMIGFGFGVQVALEAYRLIQDRINALVLLAGSFESALRADDQRRWFPVGIKWLIEASVDFPHAVKLFWQIATRSPITTLAPFFVGANRRFLGRTQMAAYVRHLQRMNPVFVGQLVMAMLRNTAWNLLPTISIPTLVVAGENDGIATQEVTRAMAERIPGSQFSVLPRVMHAVLIEQPELLNLIIEKFLVERVASAIS